MQNPFKKGKPALDSALYITKQMLPTVLLFELLYKGVTLLIVKPLLTVILQLMLTITGYQLAFNGNIWGFFLTLPGIVAAVLLIVLSAVFIYYEFAVIILLAYGCKCGQPVTLWGAMQRALPTLKSLVTPGFVGFAVYALALLPIANMGLSSTLLPALSIPNFISGELTKSAWGPFLLGALGLLVLLVFFCTIFTVPVMVLKGLGFGRAFVESFTLLTTAGKKLVGFYGAFLLVWSVVYGLPRAIFMAIFRLPQVGLGKIVALFGFSWQTLVLGILLLAAMLMRLFLMPVLLFIVVVFYTNWADTASFAVDPSDALLIKGSQTPLNKQTFANMWRFVKQVWTKIVNYKWVKKYRVILLVVLSLAIIVGLYSILNRGVDLHDPIVIGHRGSGYAVENTLEAIQGAIDAGADYAEVDFFLSSDNVPMVIHDVDLARLTGQSGMVYEKTAAELSALTLTQDGHTGKISTLDEVVKFAKGKIGLAVELKLHGHETENSVDHMIGVLEDNDFLDECIFLSLEYALIEELNEKRPEAVAGYCVYGNVGVLNPSLIRTMKIDFVVVEEAMASPDLVHSFRKSWLPVYVWTVNNPDSMRAYLEMGILGLVTDDPVAGVEVLRAFNAVSGKVYLNEGDWGYRE